MATTKTTLIVYVITALGLLLTRVHADSSQQKHHHQPNHSGQQPQQHHRKSSHQQHQNTPLESCNVVRQTFVDRGIGPGHLVPQEPLSGSGLKQCPSPRTCCRDATVHRYQNSIVQDYDSVLSNVMAPLKALLEESITDFETHFNQLLQISLNKTNHLFQAVYPRMATTVEPRLRDLYSDFSAFLLLGQKVDVLDSVRSFFDGLFPSVYYHALNPKLTDFTGDYKECLQQARSEVRPFGHIMRGIELTVPHALTAAELFLNALRTGSDVLNATTTITTSQECKHALLKLTYCSHCSGHTSVPPCWGMCLNVMRGCLAHQTEIDRNWNQYVNALEDLIGVMKSPFNTEEVFSDFPDKISEAIMHALEHGKDLDGRVRRACGQAKREKPSVHAKQVDATNEDDQKHHRERRNAVVSPSSSSSSASSSQAKQESSSDDHHHPENLAGRLHAFLTAITPSKGFFFNLGDTTCKDKKFSGHAHQGQHCWNGIEIGAYNRTIVGVGMERQENNPELKVQKDGGANSKVVTTILEKLLRIKQHVTGSAVTRDVSKSSKRTRSGKQDVFNVRGARNAQYTDGYGWSNMDTGSGYYDRYGDQHYEDDEDLYQGSGDGGSGGGGYEVDSGSGGGGGYDHTRNHPSKSTITKNGYHENRYDQGEFQPKATKNPAQTGHTYNVYPVRAEDGAGLNLHANTRLILLAVVSVKLLLGILSF